MNVAFAKDLCTKINNFVLPIALKPQWMKITLLDNKEYRTDALLEKMKDDDFYYGELGELALSSSAIKLLYESLKNITM